MNATQTCCKFQIQEVTETQWDATTPREGEPTPKKVQKISLSAVCDDKKDPENASFANSTPTGSLTFTVRNLNVIGAFKPGAYYHVDLMPA